MSRTRRARLAAALGALACAPGPAAAAPPPTAIDVDRDTTPPGQAELSFDGGAPIGTWALGATLGFVERPIIFTTADSRAYPVDYRETLALGGALALGDHLIVDAKLPLSHQVGTRLRGFGDDDAALDRWVVGDLALGARVRVVQTEHVALFFRGDLTLPTGDQNDFAGEASWTLSWLGIARVTLPHAIALAGTAGVLLRADDVEVEDQLVGDALVWGAGATIGIPPIAHLWCDPEQLRAALEFDGEVGDRNVDHSHGPSPAEVKVGVIGRVRPEYAIAVRVGTHLDDQLGAPLFRATIDLVYQPHPASARPALSQTRRDATPAESTDDDGDE